MAAPKEKSKTKKRRDEVLDYMRTVGPFSLPAKALAESHGCTSKTIYRDRDYWLKRIKFKDISMEGKKVLMGLMKNLSITEEIKAKGTVGDRLKAIRESNSTAEVFNKILESFGFKEKVAERIDIEGISNEEIIRLAREARGEAKRKGKDGK